MERNCYLVVLAVPYDKNLRMPYSLYEILSASVTDKSSFEPCVVTSKNGSTYQGVICKNNFGFSKLSDLLSHYTTPDKAAALSDDSPLGALFLAYSAPVFSKKELPAAQAQALQILEYRFYCERGVHFLGHTALNPSAHSSAPVPSPLPLQPAPSYFSKEEVAASADPMTDYIKSFNKSRIDESLAALQKKLKKSNWPVVATKLFLMDFALQIKENIARTYPDAEAFLISNANLIYVIDSKDFLYEILDFLAETFDDFMKITRNPSRDTILDDVIYYINHNYQDNIKLETIAPLFGYNSAYLGKIFSKAVGENFNAYIDRCRIEAAKELLSTKKLKVYEIAEAIGYKNVDYFHKKFKKQVGMSPAEYRKRM